MRTNSLFLILTIISITVSCKKEAGLGGKASISGKIWYQEWNSNFTTLQLEREGYDQDVYIQYGDEISYGNRIKTSYNGRFEFNYLRPGKYKVYCYSKDPSDKDNVNPDAMMVVLEEIEILEKEQKIELDPMFVLN
jgi:hypothetical protein